MPDWSAGRLRRYRRAATTIFLPSNELAKALKSHDHPVMILENKSYVPGQQCEVMMGEHSRHIKLVEFLEQGEDYVPAAFEWHEAPKK